MINFLATDNTIYGRISCTLSFMSCASSRRCSSFTTAAEKEFVNILKTINNYNDNSDTNPIFNADLKCARIQVSAWKLFFKWVFRSKCFYAWPTAELCFPFVLTTLSSEQSM